MSSSSITLLAPPRAGDWLWAWLEPNGVVRSLSSFQMTVKVGPSGLRFPPIQLVEDDQPFVAGARFRRTKLGASTLHVPVLFQEVTTPALFSLLRAAAVWFDPTRGAGTLRSTAPDGIVRQIVVRCMAGLDFDESDALSGTNARQTVLSLRADDPFWTDPADILNVFTIGQGQGSFFPWDGLFRLNASALFAEASISNDGDVDAWPVWTIIGPAVQPQLTNLTTGAILRLDLTLGAGDRVTIDTRPNVKSIVDGSGNNRFGRQSVESSLWPLARGVNRLRAELVGATDASSVQLAYRSRFYGP